MKIKREYLMHFSIILNRKNKSEQNLAYGLIFVPCPVFVKGYKKLKNIHPTYTPNYQLGSIKNLLEKENLDFPLNENNEAVIAVRDIGHGTEKDLRHLKYDLEANGFNTKVYRA